MKDLGNWEILDELLVSDRQMMVLETLFKFLSSFVLVEQVVGMSFVFTYLLLIFVVISKIEGYPNLN